MDKHTVKVRQLRSVGWLVSINLHPYDVNHADTCFFRMRATRPTARQVRRFKKAAQRHKRLYSNRGYANPSTPKMPGVSPCQQ